MENKVKALSIAGMPTDKIELLKRTVCKSANASDDEFSLFLHVCHKSGLDPFSKQIYAIKRKGVMTIQTSIDGLRLIADRTGNYAPGRESTYAYNAEGGLLSATSYLKKKTEDGVWHEISATAFWAEYRPQKYTDNPDFWDKMPHVMLAKCAEAAAVRKAFPAETSGLYSDDEMQQADQAPKDSIPIEVVEDKLSFEQCQEIETMLGEDVGMSNRILKWYQVQKLSDIKAKEYKGIVFSIQKKKNIGVAV